MSKPERASGAQSLERALSILEIMKEEKWVSAKDLAERVGLHRSSIYRLLSVLQRWGYVRGDPQGTRFTLGWRFLEMTDRINLYEELPGIATPFLEGLMRQTRETTHLMSLEGIEVVYLAKVESPETIRMHSRVGARRPAYCTAGGKVLLSCLPSHERERRLQAASLNQLTPKTICDRERLLATLEESAHKGWAIDDEETEVGVRCVATAIKRRDGVAVAAISVSAPTFRTPLERLLEFLPLVRRTAEDVGKALQI